MSKQLLVPLITPLYHDAIDSDSIISLIEYLDPLVDGYVPCLSSGEGPYLSDSERSTVVSTIKTVSKKPIYAGIKKSGSDLLGFLERRYRKGLTNNFVIPVINPADQVYHDIIHILQAEQCTVIRYIADDTVLSDDIIQILLTLPLTVGWKDSRGDIGGRDRLITQSRKYTKISGRPIWCFQGMENHLHNSPTMDGAIVAGAHIDPERFRHIINKHTREPHDIIYLKNLRYTYNLCGSHRYVSIKQHLANNNYIRSAEQVHSLSFSSH